MQSMEEISQSTIKKYIKRLKSYYSSEDFFVWNIFWVSFIRHQKLHERRLLQQCQIPSRKHLITATTAKCVSVLWRLFQSGLHFSNSKGLLSRSELSFACPTRPPLARVNLETTSSLAGSIFVLICWTFVRGWHSFVLGGYLMTMKTRLRGTSLNWASQLQITQQACPSQTSLNKSSLKGGQPNRWDERPMRRKIICRGHHSIQLTKIFIFFTLYYG